MEKNTEKDNELEQNEEILSEGQPRAEATDEVSDLEGMTAEAKAEQSVKAELAATKDKYLRLYSEFENFRRRTSKEKIEMIQTASEQVLKAMLPVLDDFERAEKASENQNTDVEGFALIHNKFKRILEQNGVKVMDVKTGSDFDADYQEAITQIPAPEEKLKGKVVDVVEKGYLLNDKVIRFAKVVVGN